MTSAQIPTHLNDYMAALDALDGRVVSVTVAVAPGGGSGGSAAAIAAISGQAAGLVARPALDGEDLAAQLRAVLASGSFILGSP